MSLLQNPLALAGFALLGLFLSASSVWSQELELPVTEQSAPLARLQYLEQEVASLRGRLEQLPDAADEASLASYESLAADAAPAKPPPPKFPTVGVNGVFQAQFGVFNQNADSLALTNDPLVSDGRIQNGASFRRARLSAKGAVATHTNYFMQLDFAFFGRPTFTDVWVEQTDLPIVGNARIGQWKHPFSLEVVSSFRYTTFLERSLLFQAFTPFRHLGFGIYDQSDDENSTWAASLIRTGQDQFGGSLSTDGGNGFVARATRLFGYDESCGEHYFHTGFAYYLNSPPRDLVRFRTVPEIFIGEVAPGDLGSSRQPVPGSRANGTPFLVDTGPLLANTVNTIGWEGLYVHGPFSVQTELMGAWVDRIGGGTPFFYGSYVTCSYFLTGEHRAYDRKAGALDRIKPLHDFLWTPGCACGWGAWELAGRWSMIDLTDAGVNGGVENNATFCLNWYLNSYTKLSLNYIHAWVDRPLVAQPNLGIAETNVFAGMAQLDF